MGKTVGISEYDKDRIETFLKIGIRQSRAQIVHEALALYYPKLEREADWWLDWKSQRQPLEVSKEAEEVD